MERIKYNKLVKSRKKKKEQRKTKTKGGDLQ